MEAIEWPLIYQETHYCFLKFFIRRIDMASPLNPNEVIYDIVPMGYIASVKNRVNVQELPKEKIQEIMKTADVFTQEVILQDLLLAGKKMETLQDRNMVALAAELFVQTPGDTQRDFLIHLHYFTEIYKKFSSAVLANSLFHEKVESQQKGSSGLTFDQLEIEKTYAVILNKK